MLNSFYFSYLIILALAIVFATILSLSEIPFALAIPIELEMILFSSSFLACSKAASFE